MLNVGQDVPTFEAQASTGGKVSRDSLLGTPYVLFFYPKSFTSGCTIETRRFAELAPDIQAKGAQIVGVSMDSLETQCKFAESTGAEFPILADTDGSVSRAFDVKRMLLPVSRRVTYVIDEKGRVEAAFAMELKFKEHVDKVLAHLDQRTPA